MSWKGWNSQQFSSIISQGLEQVHKLKDDVEKQFDEAVGKEDYRVSRTTDASDEFQKFMLEEESENDESEIAASDTFVASDQDHEKATTLNGMWRSSDHLILIYYFYLCNTIVLERSSQG